MYKCNGDEGFDFYFELRIYIHKVYPDKRGCVYRDTTELVEEIPLLNSGTMSSVALIQSLHEHKYKVYRLLGCDAPIPKMAFIIVTVEKISI
jgi:hypothetical protein